MNAWDQNVINHQNMLRDEPTGTERWYQIQAGLQQAYRDQAAHANDPDPNATPAAAGPSPAQQSSITALSAQYNSIGLGGLVPQITDWIRQGLSTDAIDALVRQTSEFANRFPAIAAGVNISVADYLNYERTAAQLEQQYGLPSGLVTGNVNTLLTNYVSASELNARIQLAVADSYTASQDLRQQIKDFYGVDSVDADAALKAYYLDPDNALPAIEKQSTAARIAVQARRQGLNGGIDRAQAERLQGLGVTEQQAQQGFGTVAGLQGLQYGLGDTASQQTLIDAALVGDAGALQGVQRAQRARAGRFQGGGQVATDNRGVTGAGTATRQ